MVHPQAAAAGKAIHELHLPADCVLVAIIRQGSLVIPHGATQLQAGDEVLALVHARHVQQLAELIGPTNVER